MIKLDDFYEGDTVAFDLYLSKNGSVLDISEDTVSMIFKKLKSDSDEDAVLAIDSISNSTKGLARFVLSSEDTALSVRNYYVEIKLRSDGATYILYSSTVRVLERVYDV